MLLGEDGGRSEQGDLLACNDGFENSAEGDFCFAKANVASAETIHGALAHHVTLNILRRLQLGWRWLIGERIF